VDTITDVSKPTLSGVARVLVHGGKLAAARAEELVRSAKEKKVSFISELMGSGELSPAQLAHALSSALAVPLLDLDAVDVQRLPKNIIDAKLIGQYHVLPLNKRGSRLFLACADPTDQEASERIKFATQLSPEWVVVEHDKLSKLLEDKPGRPTRPWRPSVRQTSISRSRKKTRRERPPADVVSEVEDAPVVRFLQKMLVDAINMRASDLHFEPYEYHYRVRFRVDGELREITQPPLAIKDKLASRIKVISRLDISEKRVPQDGRMKLRFGSKSIDFRVSTLPTLFGEKIVIRILDSSSAKLGIEALGYEPAEKERLLHAITALRHGAGDRPDRLGQDGVALHLPEHPEPAGREHLHGRGPGGNQPAGHQPGQRQRQGRPDLRQRAEVLPAPGSGHHHGRRNPRPGNRRHRDQGRADRPPGAVHAAHQRRPPR
jgi:type IV pilus assembly protein PilB